jgi:hypothetical protein
MKQTPLLFFTALGVLAQATIGGGGFSLAGLIPEQHTGTQSIRVGLISIQPENIFY